MFGSLNDPSLKLLSTVCPRAPPSLSPTLQYNLVRGKEEDGRGKEVHSPSFAEMSKSKDTKPPVEEVRGGLNSTFGTFGTANCNTTRLAARLQVAAPIP